MKYLIVGAGFSGAVIAEQLSKNIENKLLIVDERDHIGGNCYSKRDVETDIIEHVYGPHIFHTSNKCVWDYVSTFCKMMPFVNRVKSLYKGVLYPLPINLRTINQFFNKNFTPEEAEGFIQALGDKSIHNPANFEQQALKFIGKELYEAFFYGYTKKQWGCEPRELPSIVLKRLPVRFTSDDNYYSDVYQGIPENGYTEIFEKMLSSSNIELKLNTKFDNSWDMKHFDHIFYSGPIDAFFNYEYGRLSYRTVFFEKNVGEGDFQGNAVINYADENVPFTRIHEHKHFTPWQQHEKTIYFKEFSKETESGDIPYYPKRLENDLRKLELYKMAANQLTNITFVGRLGTYRYLDMHQIIEEALNIAAKHIN